MPAGIATNDTGSPIGFANVAPCSIVFALVVVPLQLVFILVVCQGFTIFDFYGVIASSVLLAVL